MASKAQLIELYLKTKDEIEEIENASKTMLAPLKKRLTDIETLMATKMDADGETNARTDFGTAYFSVIDFAKINDPNTFFEFVKSHEAWDMLEKRVAKLAVRSYLDANNILPPGVDYGTKREVHIRRSAK